MKKIILIAFISIGTSCMHLSKITPPQAEKIDHKMEKHGDVRNDPYFWLNDLNNPKVIQYLKNENTFTENVLLPVKELEKKLFEEMKNRVIENDETVPYREGDYYYYSRFEKNQQYPIYNRKKHSLNAPEEIILNVNSLAVGKHFTSIAGLKVSSDQQILAYAVDYVGRRFYDIHFVDLKTGKELSNKIMNTSGDFEWAGDNQTLFYIQQNQETLRSEKLFRYQIKSQKSDLVYFEKDDTFNIYIYKSLTKKYIYLGSSSTLSSEIRYLQTSQPFQKFKIFYKREAGHEYSVTDGHDAFYIITNKNAKNYKLLKTSFDKTDLKYWQTIIPHAEDNYISSLIVFENYIAVSERKLGLPQIHIFSKDLKNSFYIPFSDKNYLASFGNNSEYQDHLLRYEYESMRQPETTFDYNMSTQTQDVVKIKQIPNYNSELYETERIFVKATDGAQIPVSILKRKDIKKDGSASMLIYGYGSYGANMDPWFSQSIFSLVDRGFVYVIAHVRGGSEMGRDWFDDGRVLNKKNTFTDFINVTESLINQNYANKNKIFAMGGSAGGLLMGAITNIRPDLYKGVVAQVPFVDVITTMLDDSIPLTTGEYDQWGNPNEKKYYDYIKSYSPYDNVVAKPYPNILITTGLHDSQVQYWEPAKWAAKLREMKTNDALILLKTDMGAGHAGASGRFNQLIEKATEYCFILMVNEKK